MVRLNPALRARTGSFPLKGRGPVIGVLAALQLLRRHGHPGALRLTWGIMLAGVWDSPQMLQITPFSIGAHFCFSHENWKCAVITNMGDLEHRGGLQRWLQAS